jgi:transcription termination/antitermination protein NusA
MNAEAFRAAIDEIATSKGLTHEAVVEALTYSLERAYAKSLGGDGDETLAAPTVEVKIDETMGLITIAQIKDVVKDVEDDFLQVSVADAKEIAHDSVERMTAQREEILETLKAKKKNPMRPYLESEVADLSFLIDKTNESVKGLKIGDKFKEYCPLEEINKLTAGAVKGNLRAKLGEAERVALYDVYKDHIGEMVTGTVEKADDRSVSVNIGRTVVELGRREMIGDEFFKVGDPIKVYIQEVKQADEEGKPSHGPQIEVTRSSEGFLKRLFEEEIHEIYDGTVLIRGIAREAGIRSKVAVSSNNEDVDATGACIGPGGSRIQKIVSQLGNGKDKEKIDIIAYSDNPGLYIAESLRPAQVLGVNLNPPADELAEDDDKREGANPNPRPRAIAVVKDDQQSLAIGKKGANARLANRLTGWTIDILSESQAKDDNLAYTPTEELVKQAEEEKKEAERKAYAEKSKADAAKREEEAAEAKAAEDARKAEEAANNIVTPTVAPAVTSAEAAPVVAPVASAAPAVQPVEAKPVAQPVVEEKPTVVQTTTTLADLEKELEAAKEKKTVTYTKNRRPRNISEDEVKHVKPSEVQTPAAGAMPIYSQEELDQIAAEETENAPEETTAAKEEAEEDIDQYDKYYDDDNK